MLTIEDVVIDGQPPDWLRLLVYADFLEDVGEPIRAEAVRFLVANERWPERVGSLLTWYCVCNEGRPVSGHSCWLPREMGVQDYEGFFPDLADALTWYLERYATNRDAVKSTWESGTHAQMDSTPRMPWRSPYDLAHVEGYSPSFSESNG